MLSSPDYRRFQNILNIPCLVMESIFNFFFIKNNKKLRKKLGENDYLYKIGKFQPKPSSFEKEKVKRKEGGEKVKFTRT